MLSSAVLLIFRVTEMHCVPGQPATGFGLVIPGAFRTMVPVLVPGAMPFAETATVKLCRGGGRGGRSQQQPRDSIAGGVDAGRHAEPDRAGGTGD